MSPSADSRMTTTTTTNTETKRLLLVSVPRTASNLLLKVLNIHHQPNIHTSAKGGYFFYDAYMTATLGGHLNKPNHAWTESERRQTRAAFQQCLDALEEQSAQAQRDQKVLFAKEHAFWFVNPAAMQMQPALDASLDASLAAFRLQVPGYGPTTTFSGNNATVLPDEYLRTWRIAFIVRHPALAWPSMYRAMVKIAALGLLDDDGVKGASVSNMTLAWTRRLFDWCLEQPDEMTVPVVIDAHDIIHNPGSVLRFCEETGLDTSVVQMEWDDDVQEREGTGAGAGAGADTDDNSEALSQNATKVMLSTLKASKGVVKDKAPVMVDIPAEAEKWRAEFGDEIAAMLEKAVWDAMPDYEYLKERRVC